MTEGEREREREGKGRREINDATPNAKGVRLYRIQKSPNHHHLLKMEESMLRTTYNNKMLLEIEIAMTNEPEIKCLS